MHDSLFTNSPTERHLGCFQVLAIMNKAAVNICVQVFVGHINTFPMHLGEYQSEQRFLLVCLCCYYYCFNDGRDLRRVQATGKDVIENKS